MRSGFKCKLGTFADMHVCVSVLVCSFPFSILFAFVFHCNSLVVVPSIATHTPLPVSICIRRTKRLLLLQMQATDYFPLASDGQSSFCCCRCKQCHCHPVLLPTPSVLRRNPKRNSNGKPVDLRGIVCMTEVQGYRQNPSCRER
jgi:hypothetical protein